MFTINGLGSLSTYFGYHVKFTITTDYNDKVMHYFTFDKVPCISATNLISLLTHESFAKISKFIDMAKYAEIGTKAHEAIEKGISNIEYDKEYDKEYEFAVEDAKKALKALNIESYITEIWVGSKKLKIAGIIDLIGVDKEGNLWIIDWKTSSSKQYYHALQLMIYKKIIEVEMKWKDIKMACVYVRKPNAKGLAKNIFVYEEVDSIITSLVKIHFYKIKQSGNEYWK